MRRRGIQADLGFRQHMVAAVSDGAGAGVGLQCRGGGTTVRGSELGGHGGSSR